MSSHSYPMRRKGWIKPDPGSPWKPDDSTEPQTMSSARDVSPSALKAVKERTAEEMLAEVMRLANQQLAGLSSIAVGTMLNDAELAQLGVVQRIILGNMRTLPEHDPLEQRDGESDAEYLERLERMKGKAK